MELGSKSKRSFKLKSSHQKENALRSWFDNSHDGQHGGDEDNFGTFYKPDGTKTPVSLRGSKKTSSCSQNISPQFRVGWNDGSQKNICDVGSPVSAISARRKIRRCPENLLSKISPPVIKPEENRNNEKNDILQCINWAKSLIGSTIQSPLKEEPETHDKSISDITESIKDTSLDLALDDSSNELMILCSQAVEESVSTGKLIVENKKTESEKHHITPNRDTNPNKRFKPQINSNNVSKGYISNFDRRLNSFDKKLNAASSVDNLSKQFGFSAGSILEDDLFNDDIFKRPNQTSVNNNHANFKNFNSTSLKITGRLCESLKQNEIISPMVVTSSVSDKTSSASSNSDILTQLDDEDDIFNSLDLNFLDSLHQNTVEPLKPTSKPVTEVIKPQAKNNESITLDTKPLVTKYTKQEIEKRRQEAKKRLLFNKKHRSM